MGMARLIGAGLIDRARRLIAAEATRNRPAGSPRQLRKDRTNEQILQRINNELKAASPGSAGLSKYDKSLLRQSINQSRLEINQLNRSRVDPTIPPVKGGLKTTRKYDVEVVVVRSPDGKREFRGRGYIPDATSTDTDYLIDRIKASEADIGEYVIEPSAGTGSKVMPTGYMPPVRVIVLDVIEK